MNIDLNNFFLINLLLKLFILAPKPCGRRSRKPGIDRKPRQAYSAKQLEMLEAEFKVYIVYILPYFISWL